MTGHPPSGAAAGRVGDDAGDGPVGVLGVAGVVHDPHRRRRPSASPRSCTRISSPGSPCGQGVGHHVEVVVRPAELLRARSCSDRRAGRRRRQRRRHPRPPTELASSSVVSSPEDPLVVSDPSSEQPVAATRVRTRAAASPGPSRARPATGRVRSAMDRPYHSTNRGVRGLVDGRPDPLRRDPRHGPLGSTRPGAVRVPVAVSERAGGGQAEVNSARSRTSPMVPLHVGHPSLEPAGDDAGLPARGVASMNRVMPDGPGPRRAHWRTRTSPPPGSGSTSKPHRDQGSPAGSAPPGADATSHTIRRQGSTSTIVLIDSHSPMWSLRLRPRNRAPGEGAVAPSSHSTS